jgi:hypothetical protein
MVHTQVSDGIRVAIEIVYYRYRCRGCEPVSGRIRKLFGNLDTDPHPYYCWS